MGDNQLGNEGNVDMYNSWCESVKNNFEKMEREYNEMILNFNTVIDNYSISLEYHKLVEINQTFGEISILLYVGRQLFYSSFIEMVEYKNKFSEQAFKVLNISQDIINKILKREEPINTHYFYAEYNELKKLVYEMLNKKIMH